MVIPGYEDDPLEVGEEWLDLPGFWPAHLLWLAEGEDVDPEPEWFGVDGADTEEAYGALTDPVAWPVLRLPLQFGHRILILYRNFPEDEGVDYYLTHPSWERPRSLGSIEGHFAGPGLAWRELVHIAQNPGTGPGVTTPHARLLLLLPVLGDEALPPDAVEVVESALDAIGAPSGTRTVLAEALLDHPFWEAPPWYFHEPDASPLSGGNPTATPSRVLRCVGDWSPRTGGFGLSPDEDICLAKALGTAS
ncbi:hypothetical protein [Streptomyces aureus]|uniref:hypothetical protein n=1 Tax=Streptomyces aureus TaxID=193461 RepID=UPI0033E2935D